MDSSLYLKEAQAIFEECIEKIHTLKNNLYENSEQAVYDTNAIIYDLDLIDEYLKLYKKEKGQC